MAVPYFLHSSRKRANWRRASSWSLWKFPGLIRTFSTTEATAIAVSEEKWMSATSGTSHPAARRRALISCIYGTSCRPGTVIRTSCEPASARRRHCATVASTSYVWVLHIVWTTTGLSPPMRTFPTRTTLVSIFYGWLFALSSSTTRRANLRRPARVCPRRGVSW